MPFVGIIPPSGGLPPERRVERDRRVRRADGSPKIDRPQDEAELSSIDKLHESEKVQGDTSEEGREDRLSHGGTPVYMPGPRQTPPPAPPSIDLEG